MADLLNLSLWLRDFDSDTMLSALEELLRMFPFSQVRPGIEGVRIYAIDFTEPPLVEQAFPEAVDVDTVIGVCGDFENADCAYQVQGWWELWRFASDWKLTPSRVSVLSFGPEFDNDVGDHLRIELGADTDFLPSPDAPQSARKAQSNLASIVRLTRELERAMPVERRSLWSDSGENFADQLDEALFDED
jgi:hypothetical protein